MKRVKKGSLYMYTHEYICTHDDTSVTTKNMAAVSPSYLKPKDIGASVKYTHSQSGT